MVYSPSTPSNLVVKPNIHPQSIFLKQRLFTICFEEFNEAGRNAQGIRLLSLQRERQKMDRLNQESIKLVFLKCGLFVYK